MAESEEIRLVYSTEIILNTATTRVKLELKLIHILRREKHRITHHHSAKLQTTKQTLTTANTRLNLLGVTYLAILHWPEIKLCWLIVTGSVNQAKDGQLPLNFQGEILEPQSLEQENWKNPDWAALLKAGPVMSAWLANQILGFRIPACSDAWEKNNS